MRFGQDGSDRRALCGNRPSLSNTPARGGAAGPKARRCRRAFLPTICGGPSKRQVDAVDALARLFAGRGLPTAMRTDNGLPLPYPNRLYNLSKPLVWWPGRGIAIERIKPGHPQHNGPHERMHHTLKQEAARHIFRAWARFSKGRPRGFFSGSDFNAHLLWRFRHVCAPSQHRDLRADRRKAMLPRLPLTTPLMGGMAAIAPQVNVPQQVGRKTET